MSKGRALGTASVSVIVPFLDPGPFLLDAVASVLAQSYEDWELLLVDDGSRDGSEDVARAFERIRPERIRRLAHEGGGTRGMSASRNLGLEHARGRFVSFLDADDVWFANKLEEQVALLAAHPAAAMVYGPTEWWYSWRGNGEAPERDFVQTLGAAPDLVFQPPALLAVLLRREHPTMTPALVRREALERSGGFEDSFGGLYEDQAAFVKVAVDQPVLVSSRCWYRWRQHSRSSCAVSLASGRYEDARATFLQWLEDFLRRRDLVGSEAWVALEQARSGEEHVLRPERPRPDGRRLVRRLRRSGRAHSIDLDRDRPLSRAWGYDRGTPVDRYYIEAFLGEHEDDVRGRVLEVGGDEYARRFGAERARTVDVLHVDASNPKATIVADLASAPQIPAESFDCVICTQTLQFIADPGAAVATLHRILTPGGTVLATFPGISHMGLDEWQERWFWRFTPRSATMLFARCFGESSVQVRSYGNAATAAAFLYGLAVEDLALRQLTRIDPAYDLVLGVRAVKRA